MRSSVLFRFRDEIRPQNFPKVLICKLHDFPVFLLFPPFAMVYANKILPLGIPYMERNSLRKEGCRSVYEIVTSGAIDSKYSDESRSRR